MARQERIKWNYRIVSRFLIPYLLILLVPLLIGVIIYQKTVETMVEEAEANNIRILEQSKDMLDTRLKELEQIANQIVSNPRIYNFQSVTTPFEGATTYLTKATTGELYDFKLSNNFIYDYYVFYNNSSLVLSSNATYRYDHFYDHIYGYTEMSKEAWRSLLTSSYHQRKMLPSRKMIVRNKPMEMLTYVQSMSMSRPEGGAVVLLIDSMEISKLLESLVVSREGWAYVADASGNIILSVADTGVQWAPLPDSGQSTGLIQHTSDTQKMLVSYTTSGYNGWTYVVAQPSYLVLNKVNYIKSLMLTLLVVALLTGVLIAFYLAWRSSKPLKKLFNNAWERLEEKGTRPRDAYQLIDQTLQRLSSNNDELAKRVEEQLPMLKLTLLDHLLRGEFASERELDRMQRYVGLNIGGRYYAIVITVICPVVEHGEERRHVLDRTRVLLKELILRAASERGMLYDMDQYKTALLFVSDAHSSEAAKQELEQVVATIRDVTLEQLNIGAQIAVGDVVDQLLHVSHSFEQSKKVLLRRAISRHEVTVDWHDDLTEEKHRYEYPTELEGRLFNCAKAGEREEVGKLLAYLRSENLHARQLSIPVLRLFLHELMGTLAKLLEHVDKQAQEQLPDLESMLSELDAGQERTAAFERIEQLFDLVAVSMQQQHQERRTSRNRELRDKITDYLDEHYGSPDCTLASVANTFRLTEAYLSQFYKDQTGENFSDYVENKRMAQARMLLLEGCPVIDVAQHVGYSTANTFGRAFKRIHGMSATAFRRTHPELPVEAK